MGDPSIQPIPTAAPAGDSRLRILDALRGMAALYVAVGHARYLLHEGLTGFREHPEAYSLLQNAAVHALGCFGWGHEAVILFFVLSGFAIHLRHAREQAELGIHAQFRPGSYLWRRTKRLYPPLLLALALTFALDRLGMHAGWSIYNGRTPHDMINKSGPFLHDGRTLIGNLSFAMDNWQQTPFAAYGTDKPLWSLRYEASFYLLYPLLWLANRRGAWLALGAALALALAFALSPSLKATPGLIRNPLELLLVWWLGGFLAEIFTGRVRLPMGWLAGFVLCLPLGLRLPGAESALFPEPCATWLLGLGFFGLIAAALAWRGTLARWRGIEMIGKLGDCSYTLYVIHMPVLVFIGGWLMSRAPDGRLPASPAWVLPGVALCVLLAWLAHFLVEKPFMGSGKKKGTPA